MQRRSQCMHTTRPAQHVCTLPCRQHWKVGLQMMQTRMYAASSTSAVMITAMRAFCHHMCRRSTRACSGQESHIRVERGLCRCLGRAQACGKCPAEWLTEGTAERHTQACTEALPAAHLPLEGKRLLAQGVCFLHEDFESLATPQHLQARGVIKAPAGWVDRQEGSAIWQTGEKAGRQPGGMNLVQTVQHVRTLRLSAGP